MFPNTLYSVEIKFTTPYNVFKKNGFIMVLVGDTFINASTQNVIGHLLPSEIAVFTALPEGFGIQLEVE